ncbi:UNKNOWN [Stylonychia lemnae]|uniref:Transmembrane protein n=1 Tax=Stylonychia lemnae TaxID=5949 RepID=A0A077ZSA9_STYLE|nr:UNKNOWN [Stylonychia lemnae]|eukprot:CDW72762.1 UNKNOWN [Stylonychia lemnae]
MDIYPNLLSYGITQLGIIMSNEIFYSNVMYEIFGPVKQNVQIFQVIPLLEQIENEKPYKGYPFEINLRRYPMPPDSMAKYMYQIKFPILFQTIMTQLTVGGTSSFLAHYFKKFLYIWHQRPDKILKISNLLKMVGCFAYFYYFTQSIQLAVQLDSFFMKFRYLCCHIFVILTLTYPCTYTVLLHLIFEMSVLSILFRFFVSRNSVALSEAFSVMLHNDENFADLVHINQELMHEEMQQNQLNERLQQRLNLINEQRDQLFPNRRAQNHPHQNSNDDQVNNNLRPNEGLSDEQEEDDEFSDSQASDNPEQDVLQEFLMRNTMRMQGQDADAIPNNDDDDSSSSYEEEEEEEKQIQEIQQTNQEFIIASQKSNQERKHSSISSQKLSRKSFDSEDENIKAINSMKSQAQENNMAQTKLRKLNNLTPLSKIKHNIQEDLVSLSEDNIKPTNHYDCQIDQFQLEQD